MALEPTDHFVSGELPVGVRTAFAAALNVLSEHMDIKRIALSIEGGQDGFVQSAYICNATSPRQLSAMLRRHADAVDSNSEFQDYITALSRPTDARDFERTTPWEKYEDDPPSPV